VLREYVEHYNRKRPHRTLALDSPDGDHRRPFPRQAGWSADRCSEASITSTNGRREFCSPTGPDSQVAQRVGHVSHLIQVDEDSHGTTKLHPGSGKVRGGTRVSRPRPRLRQRLHATRCVHRLHDDRDTSRRRKRERCGGASHRDASPRPPRPHDRAELARSPAGGSVRSQDA
jgi:hypothetical protein